MCRIFPTIIDPFKEIAVRQEVDSDVFTTDHNTTTLTNTYNKRNLRY